MNNLIIHSFKTIIQFLPKEYRQKSIWVLCLLFFNSVLELFGLASLIPLISIILDEDLIVSEPWIRNIYDNMGFVEYNYFIVFLCIVIILILFVKNIISLCIIKYQSDFSYSLFVYVSTNLQKYFYRQGFQFIKNTNSNIIVKDIYTVSYWFVVFIVLSLLQLMNESIILIIISSSLIIYNFKIVLIISIIIIPAAMSFYRYVRSKMEEIGIEKNMVTGEVNKSLYQSIHGFVDVETNNTHDIFFSQYGNLANKLRQLSVKENVFKAMVPKIIETTIILGIIFVIFYGIFFFENNSDLILILGLFGLAAFKVVPSVNKILASLLLIKQYQFTFDTIKNIKYTNQYLSKSNLEDVSFTDSIELKNVSFAYQESLPILKKISFVIKKGETVGIIGKSGSGKTTLMNLILRFLVEQEGTIFVDGISLNKSNLKSWRDLIGYVQQEVFLIDATLAENIAFGVSLSKIDFRRMESIITKTSLKDLVDKLPLGVNSYVGERGAQLSGGQRQRIGIARALYFGASILLFDEATSALDNETELEITESLNNLKGEYTIIIIAHRLSTLKYCDRVIRLEKGAIERIS